MHFLETAASRERFRRLSCTLIAAVWLALLIFALLRGATPTQWIFGLIMTTIWTAMASILWREHHRHPTNSDMT